MKKHMLVALLALGFVAQVNAMEEQEEVAVEEAVKSIPVKITSGEVSTTFNIPVEDYPATFNFDVQVGPDDNNDTLNLVYKVDDKGNVRLSETTSAMTRIQKRVQVKVDELVNQKVQAASKAIEAKVLKLFGRFKAQIQPKAQALQKVVEQVQAAAEQVEQAAEQVAEAQEDNDNDDD